MNDLIQILDFDTELFGFKVGKYAKEKLTLKEAEKVLKECEKGNIKCLFANLDINDFESINAANKYGFLISDVKIVLEKNITDFWFRFGLKEEYEINDEIGPEDFYHLIEISKEISAKSRFAFDPNFPQLSAEKVYEKWMLNSIDKKVADSVLVARGKKTRKPVGVVTCKNESNHGEIVLIGVSKKKYGRGIGSLLLDYACNNFKEKNYKQVRIKTQGNNIPALRLYQKNGFFIQKTLLTYHLWNK